MSDKCGSCGVAWADHLGVEGTCKEIARLKAENERLREALKAAVYCVDNHCEGELGPCDCDQAEKARAALKED